MPKMYYFSNSFPKSAKRGAPRPQRFLVFNIDDLKLGDLTKL